MDVKVLNVVKSCNTAQEGEQLFYAIWPNLKKDLPVEISFEGVAEVTSSFVNASIVRVVLKKDYEAIEARLSISNISKASAEMIRRCVNNALAQKAR